MELMAYQTSKNKSELKKNNSNYLKFKAENKELKKNQSKSVRCEKTPSSQISMQLESRRRKQKKYLKK